MRRSVPTARCWSQGKRITFCEPPQCSMKDLPPLRRLGSSCRRGADPDLADSLGGNCSLGLSAIGWIHVAQALMLRRFRCDQETIWPNELGAKERIQHEDRASPAALHRPPYSTSRNDLRLLPLRHAQTYFAPDLAAFTSQDLAHQGTIS